MSEWHGYSAEHPMVDCMSVSLVITQKKNTIHQVTTMLTTPKMSYFRVKTTC